MSEDLTLLLNITTADADQADALTRNLLRELRDSDVVEQAALQETAAPDGAKGAWGERLKVTFSPQNLEKLFQLISANLPFKPSIEMELEVQGKKLKLKANSREDFEFAMQQAREFVQE
jgi:hypothetical protein